MGQIPHFRSLKVPLTKEELVAHVKSSCHMLNNTPTATLSMDEIVHKLTMANCPAIKKILQFR